MATGVAVLGGILAGTLAQAQSLDAGIEQYRSHLLRDVGRTLRERADDKGAVRQAWIDVRVGWERSEVFTAAYVPELDRAIDAWPVGTTGFHAKPLAGRTPIADQADTQSFAARDLRHIDPERLRAATEELVVRLQHTAPLLSVRKPALEADVRWSGLRCFQRRSHHTSCERQRTWEG